LPARQALQVRAHTWGGGIVTDTPENSDDLGNPGDAALRDMLTKLRRVAVVGVSDREERASHGIAKFLIGRGLDVVGVNPALQEVLGRPVYPSLADVPGEVDLVDVFRRGETVGPIVDEAIAKRAPVVWMQLGVVNHEAAARARAAGLAVVMDRCILQEWLRLLGA
jgi:predicted CoA-binding protein